MKFSLIVATKNRVEQVERLLESLVSQSEKDFEVIIVDQNLDARLAGVVNSYSSLLSIAHIKQQKPGTSRARNQGIKLACGEIIAFPDDDCLYPPDTLKSVSNFFNDQEWDGLTVRVMDLQSDRDAFSHCLQTSRAVDYATGISVGIGPSMFFRSQVAKSVAFDESMGPGEKWVGGEDTDYLLRCLDWGATVYYSTDLFVRHPRPKSIYSLSQLIRREFTYGRGCGYLMRKHHATPKEVIREFWIPFGLLGKYTITGKFRDALTCPGMGIARILGYWEGMQHIQGGKDYYESEVRSN